MLSFDVERRYSRNKNSLINLYMYMYIHRDDAKIAITAEIIT